MAAPTFATLWGQTFTPGQQGAGDIARLFYTVLVSGQNPDGTAYALPVTQTAGGNPIPIMQPNVAGNAAGTAITATSGVVAAATATCTLAGTAGKFTWLTGFVVSGDGATAASSVTMTIAGIVTGTQSYAIGVPASLGEVNYTVSLPTPVPSSAANTNIVLTLPSLGTGNTGASVNAFGFLL